MKLTGKGASFWRPYLREWSKGIRILQGSLTVELHRGKNAHGYFDPGCLAKFRGKVNSACYATIVLYANPKDLEQTKYIFLHELAHYTQWLRGHKFNEGKANLIALQKSRLPAGYGQRKSERLALAKTTKNHRREG